jgi:hypothetical protein
MKLRRLNFIDYRWKHAIVVPLIPDTRTLFSPYLPVFIFTGMTLPRYCGQSEKLLQKSKEDEDVIKEIIYKGV